MKKLTIIIVFLLLASVVQADTTTLKFLQTTQAGLWLADTAITDIGLQLGAHEANPFYRIGDPFTAVADLAVNIAIISSTNWLYKKNKTWGIVAIIAVNIVRGFVVFHNLKIINSIAGRAR